MYRALPSANKILTTKWQSQEHDIHLRNLSKIKGSVNMVEPQKFKHLQKKMKKTQMLEERYTEIERENRILLEKMTNILQKQRGGLLTANSAQLPPMGKTSIMNQTQESTLQPLTAPGGKRSLNRAARKRELTKITHENQMILKRLQEKKPSYNVTKWGKDEEHRKKMLRNICEFPLVEKQDSVTGYGQADFIIKKKKTSQSAGGQAFYKKTKGYTSGGNSSQVRPNTFFGNQIIKKQSLYIGQHELGNGNYNIEMLISQQDDLVISAQHEDLPDSFIIEIEAAKVQHLLSEFLNDFSLMASHLKIMNKRMVLLNPKFIAKQQEGDEGEEGKEGEAAAEGEELASGEDKQEEPLEQQQEDIQADGGQVQDDEQNDEIPIKETPAAGTTKDDDIGQEEVRQSQDLHGTQPAQALENIQQQEPVNTQQV